MPLCCGASMSAAKTSCRCPASPPSSPRAAPPSRPISKAATSCSKLLFRSRRHPPRPDFRLNCRAFQPPRPGRPTKARSSFPEAFHNNPFLAQGLSAETLHVIFLADLPSRRNSPGLDATRSAPNAFAVQGRDIYLHLPNGVADTKLTNAYLNAKLGTVSTSRNWRTVTMLTALMR